MQATFEKYSPRLLIEFTTLDNNKMLSDEIYFILNCELPRLHPLSGGALDCKLIHHVYKEVSVPGVFLSSTAHPKNTRVFQ